MIKPLNIKLPYCFYFKKKLCLIYMDILVVSNIINKFSKIFLNNNKTQLDIDVLSEFLEDPFNLDLEHLNYFYLQCGGADKAARSSRSSRGSCWKSGRSSRRRSFRRKRS